MLKKLLFYLYQFQRYEFFLNLKMLSDSKLQFREKRMQSLLIQIEILSSACVVYLKFMEITKVKRPHEVIFNKLNA